MKSYRLALFAALMGVVFSSVAPAATNAASEKPAAHTTPDLSGLSPDDIQIYQYGRIGTGSHVAGGLLGTFVGLGLGHIVYGKYTSKGFIFTIGEIGSIAIAYAGAVNGITGCLEGSSSKCGNGLGLYILGALAFTGFRIWEIVDVWTLPGSHNSRYDALKRKVEGGDEEAGRFTLMPMIAANEPKSPGFGLQLGIRF